MVGEEYPATFNMEQFKALKAFSQRMTYCTQQLQRIGSGSGRTVFKIDDTKVLKLAKNQKGVAQNGVELAYKDDWYFEGILAKVLDFDENDLWVEMELARKVTKPMFRKYFGVNPDEFGRYLTHRHNANHGKRNFFHIPPEVSSLLDQSDLFNEIYEFADAIGNVGDLGRLSTYGWVKRNGEDRIVIIDYGLDNSVYDTYYS